MANSDPREETSPGQAMDASDTHKDAADRIAKKNLLTPETRKTDDTIVVSDRDRALEADKNKYNKEYK